MPNHWRTGLGRHRISTTGSPPPPPSPGFESPLQGSYTYPWFLPVPTAPPILFIPLHAPLPVQPQSMTAPPNFTIPEARGWRPYWISVPPSEDNDSDDNDIPESPGSLAGGIGQGTGYLFTGAHLTLNVVTEYTPNQVLRAKSKGFPFMTYTCAAQATVKSVIAALKGDSGTSMTQLFEFGDGVFTKGTTIKMDADRAKDTLEKLGWASAGNKVSAPIWIVIE
jgi:hypothetical protein